MHVRNTGGGACIIPLESGTLNPGPSLYPVPFKEDLGTEELAWLLFWRQKFRRNLQLEKMSEKEELF